MKARMESGLSARNAEFFEVARFLPTSVEQTPTTTVFKTCQQLLRITFYVRRTHVTREFAGVFRVGGEVHASFGLIDKKENYS